MLWQGSFTIPFGPSDVHETIVLSAVSIFIFLLAVTLAFMLFRAIVKLYMDRQQNREGSRIRSRLLMGALALTLAPTLFSAFFNYFVLNRTLNKWFTQPARGIEMNLQDLDRSIAPRFKAAFRHRPNGSACFLKRGMPPYAGTSIRASFSRFVKARESAINSLSGERRAAAAMSNRETWESPARGFSRLGRGPEKLGKITVGAPLPSGPERERDRNPALHGRAKTPGHSQKILRRYIFLAALPLTLFVLFFPAWSAQILSRQISIPISALLGAAQEVRRGDLSYRIQVSAIDELATLVRAFNAMTSELEGNARELEARRQFTEAILESIPTGVISVSLDERIQRVNRALRGIFSDEVVSLRIN